MAPATTRNKNWWLLIAGVALLICGVVVFAMPDVFLELITVWAGISFLFSGVMGAVSYMQVRKVISTAGWHLFMAILDIVAGVMLVAHPYALADVIPWLLGIVFIGFGLVEIAGLLPFSRIMPETRTIAVISGILSALVGVMFIVWPGSLSIWVAAFTLVRGITLVAAGLMQARA